MLSNLNDSNRKIIMVIILVLIIVLVISGYFSYKDYTTNKDKKDEPKEDVVVEQNWVDFKDYSYLLPNGWNKFEDDNNANSLIVNYVDSQEINQLSAVINIQKIAAIGYNGSNLFQDATFFEEKLRSSGNYTEVGTAQAKVYGATPIIIVPCDNGGSSKVLMLYLPAYDGNFYYVKLYATKKVDHKGESYYNYEEVNTIAEILISAKKKEG